MRYGRPTTKVADGSLARGPVRYDVEVGVRHSSNSSCEFMLLKGSGPLIAFLRHGIYSGGAVKGQEFDLLWEFKPKGGIRNPQANGYSRTGPTPRSSAYRVRSSRRVSRAMLKLWQG